MAEAGAIRLVTVAPQPTAVIALTTDWGEFPALWPVLLAEVWERVRATGASAGRNVMLYKDDRPAVEVGVELLGLFEPHGRVVVSALPPGTAASTVVAGAPTRESLAAGHGRVAQWCAASGHDARGPRWEIYSHWNEDPAAMSTEILWLLA